MNVGDFVSLFPGMTMDTMAFDHPADWMAGWTLFFWAWWIAWASFVGMFLARISKGRTIGQFMLGTLTIALLTATATSLLLARYISSPIVRLQRVRG